MKNNFQFVALDAGEFAAYFEKTDDELAALGARRMSVNAQPGFPCRVSLTDAEVGEEVILLPYGHHAVNSPYRASGPIFVRKKAETAYPEINEIPPVFRQRLLSLRGYDRAAMMVFANVVEGKDLAEALSQLFENKKIEYIHVHNAKPGCFGGLVRRV